MQLSRLNLVEATLVFLPIAQHNILSPETANMHTKQIYYEDSISGTHRDTGKYDCTVLLKLLGDIVNITGTQFYVKEWTCHSSRHIRPPQQTATIDCFVFKYAFATLRQQKLDANLFHQEHNQRMRLYMAKVIFNETTISLTVHNHVTATQSDTRKRSTSAAECTDTDITHKKMPQTHSAEKEEGDS